MGGHRGPQEVPRRPHYHCSDENVLLAFYRIYRECLFIEDGADVAFFKNCEGVAAKVGILEDQQVSDSGMDAK